MPCTHLYGYCYGKFQACEHLLSLLDVSCEPSPLVLLIGLAQKANYHIIPRYEIWDQHGQFQCLHVILGGHDTNEVFIDYIPKDYMWRWWCCVGRES